MKKLSTALFQSSIFNIGAGFDLEPIKRFHHLTNTFIYTNVYIDCEEIKDWYTKEINESSDLELISVHEEHTASKMFESGTRLPSIESARIEPFQSNGFWSEFSRTFSFCKVHVPWLLVFSIRIKSTNQVVELYYFYGEGLSTYIHMSKKGKVSPIGLITVQTGKLEYPQQELDIFFHDASKPLFWLRGFWADHFVFQRYESLVAKGLYSRIGMKLNHHYKVGSFNFFDSGERHCRVFTTPSIAEKLEAYPVQTFSDKDQVVRKGWSEEACHLSKNDWSIIPKRLADKTNSEQIITWEYLADITSSHTSLAEKIAALSLPAGATLHLIPNCLESEGRQFLTELAKIPYETRTYAPFPMDFLDLKLLDSQDDDLSILSKSIGVFPHSQGFSEQALTV